MNLTPLQQDIIKARSKRFRVRRLLKEVMFKYSPYNPKNKTYLDEIITLGTLLSEMDFLKLSYTRAEVVSAFNEFYNKEAHGDKRSYLTFLCSNSLKNRKFTTPVSYSKKRNNAFSDTTSPLNSNENQRKLITPSKTPKKTITSDFGRKA